MALSESSVNQSKLRPLTRPYMDHLSSSELLYFWNSLFHLHILKCATQNSSTPQVCSDKSLCGKTCASSLLAGHQVFLSTTQDDVNLLEALYPLD